MSPDIHNAQRCGARILDANDADDSRVLAELRADSGVGIVGASDARGVRL